MDTQSLQTILTILGSTSALLAVILVCGFVINLAHLNAQQRGILEEMSTGRERYLLRGAAFILFVALVLVIGLGILSDTLRVGLGDMVGVMLLALPIVIHEYYLWRDRPFHRNHSGFVIYLTIGVVFLMLSLGSRFAAANWNSLPGVLSNSAFIGVQLIVFAIGWGVMAPSSSYEVELTLENDQTIKGHWIAQSGDEFLLQVGEAIVAVHADKVVSRTFRRVSRKAAHTQRSDR